jgi:hypothetical protein
MTNTQDTPPVLIWGRIAALAIAEQPRENHEALLADLRRRCIEEDIDIPHSVPKLIELAETYERIIGRRMTWAGARQ